LFWRKVSTAVFTACAV